MSHLAEKKFIFIFFFIKHFIQSAKKYDIANTLSIHQQTIPVFSDAKYTMYV